MIHDEQCGPTREQRAPSPLPTGPASLPVTPHRTPVPLPAHPSHRAIRVLRSPR
ncbi:hypothetical protein BJ965_004486 [Streptomyces luteogriseus]|uniref:Uncharacterized protein n=1 Tax=Streptomyces luteogriseus TaxID=68233 RepID=A0A7W7GIS4_9ACTN|nr:hypothetical protein [Streptomyces luteogriseus]